MLQGGKWTPPIKDDTGNIVSFGVCVESDEPVVDDALDVLAEELGENQVENPQEQAPQNENPQEEALPASPVEGDLPIEECLIPETNFSAVYEGAERTDEGPDSHGGRCTGDFVITNLGSEPIIVMGFDVFDNNTMEDSNYWRQYWLDPGDEHRENISYTWRPDDPDGDTFNYIARILPVRNVNACIWLVHDQALQEVLALDIPAPCH